MLKGQAKTDYQRSYMKGYRLKRKYPPIIVKSLDPVRPMLDPVRPDVQPKYLIYEGQRVEVPELDADDNIIYGDM